jgi:hypothetical protein
VLLGELPPNIKLAVVVPLPTVLLLAVFKSFNSVHELPFHFSVLAT